MAVINQNVNDLLGEYGYLHAVLNGCRQDCINAGIEKGPKSLKRESMNFGEDAIRELAR